MAAAAKNGSSRERAGSSAANPRKDGGRGGALRSDDDEGAHVRDEEIKGIIKLGKKTKKKQKMKNEEMTWTEGSRHVTPICPEFVLFFSATSCPFCAPARRRKIVH
jgi:GMP synthase-like glutamine amidotransferase